MHSIEPFLNMLNLRGAFFDVPGCRAPDGLRVSLELKQDGTSIVTERRRRLFKRAHGSKLHNPVRIEWRGQVGQFSDN
jgi:hypothetical protein